MKACTSMSSSRSVFLHEQRSLSSKSIHPSSNLDKEMVSINSLLLPLTLFLWLCSEVSVHGQPTEGDFISIDCGRPDCSYSKSYDRRITYICDDKFIDTGETHRLPDGIVTEHSPMKYLRSFPNGTRNCFRIDVMDNQKYIVRTYFLYADYDGKGKFPTFQVYVGVHYWRTIYVGVYSNTTYLVYDIILITISKSLSICLLNTNKGIPFISAIDLRPVPSNLYPEVNVFQSLVLAHRINFGANHSVWYPDDKFDRLWYKQNSTALGWKTVETTLPVETSNTINLQYNEIPQIVMQTAVVPNNGSILQFNYTPRSNVPSPNCYITLYFAELEQLESNDSRAFTVWVNNTVISHAIQPKYLQMTTFSSILHPTSNSELVQISAVNGHTRPPILNAMEIYCAADLTRQPETEVGDVNAIITIKEVYKLRRNWMGDPCIPKELKWEGLTCAYEDIINPRITIVNLSSSSLNGAISSLFGNLIQLQQLDLSNNALTGRIPESVGSLSQLKYLNLAGNNLEGQIPQAILERCANQSLILSIEGNPRLCTKQNSCMVNNNNDVQKNKEDKNHKTMIIIISSIGLGVFLIVSWKLKKCKEAQENTNLRTKGLENKTFTYRELATITKNFSDEVGRGGFGSVYRGTYKNEIQVAVKMLASSSGQGFTEFDAELTVLKRVHHKNLVPFIGYCDDNNHLALVYKLMPGGSVADHLAVKLDVMDGFGWRDRIRIACEAAQGLEYLHKGCTPSIVHRDVKTSNILLTEDMEARIADFGLSKVQVDGVSLVATRIVGSPGYLDPEYYRSNMLHEKSDVFSFGVVLMELITGKPAIGNASTGNTNLVHWVHETLEHGGIGEMIDGRLQEYNMNSVCRAMETALACCASQSAGRPDITDVLCHLKECLELETNVDNYKQKYSSTEFQQQSGSSTSVMFPSSSNSSFLNPTSR